MRTGKKTRRLFKNEQDLLDFTRSYLSEDFPNQARQGCPADHVLRALASRPAQADNTVANHLACCSPCLNAYMAHLQNTKSKQTAAQDFRQRTFRPVLIFVVCAFLFASILAIIVGRNFQRAHQLKVVNKAPGISQRVQTATHVPVLIDLTDGSPVRGAHQSHSSKVAMVLPRNPLVELTLQLPLGSERQHYTAQLRSHGRVAWTGSADSHLENRQVLLHLQADFSQIIPGKYDLLVFSTTTKLTLPVLLKSASSGG
jgi:hypothetical protein